MSSNEALNAFFKSFAAAEEEFDFSLAHETVGDKFPSVSTGSLGLDDALSCGGIPKGRLVQFYGRAGSGKTLMAMLAMKEAQKDDPTALQLWIDAEGTFDPNWAASLGMNTSTIVIIRGDDAVNGRRCFEMLLGVPKEDKKHNLAGKQKEGLLDKIKNKEINFNFIVLDSLGQIIPPGEDTSQVGKMNMALMARFLTTTLKKLSLEVGAANVPFILINHVKDTLDPYGADHTYSGGNTYTHILSANIFFQQFGGKEGIILNENEEKIGHNIKATVEKSKFGPHPRKCEFKILYMTGIANRHEEILELTLKYDIVKRPNVRSYEFGEEKWVGRDNFLEAIQEDEVLANRLLSAVEATREARLDELRQQQKTQTEAAVALALEVKAAEKAAKKESDGAVDGKKKGKKKKDDVEEGKIDE